MNLEKLVHLDLKGGIPLLNYLQEVIPKLKEWGATGLLIEYEDTFPYSGELSSLARRDAYTLDDVKLILKCASDNGLSVIPLVQTFGHMEFVLKCEEFRHLREESLNPGSICPSCSDSCDVIFKMIDQIILSHPTIKHFHIGADEVWSINKCDSCKKRNLSNEQLFLDHVVKIATYVKSKGPQPIIWDDMMRSADTQFVKASGIIDLVEPMIWYYGRKFDLDPAYVSTLCDLFPRLWAANAFKGATGPCQIITNSSHHVENTQAWLQIIADKNSRFVGIAITGWTRYDHFSVMCELLPLGLPTLSLCLRIISENAFTELLHQKCSQDLGFPELIPWDPFARDINPNYQLNFPGWCVYQGVHGLFQLHIESNSILNGDLLQGWMSSWHRKTLICNPGMALKLHTEMSNLLERYKAWVKIFEVEFRKIFSSSTVDEWLDCNVAKITRKLTKLIREASGLSSLGDCHVAALSGQQ